MNGRICVSVSDSGWLCRVIDLLHDALEPLDIPIYIVGATARDLVFKLYDENAPARMTYDLDIAISIPDWKVYDEVEDRLLTANFKKDIAVQRFIYVDTDGDEYEIDIVPFGGVSENGEIRWRPDGVPVMSVKCFDEVMSHAIEVQIGNVPVRMAPLYGQFLLKLDAWNDRNERTSKDAYDMLVILSVYYRIMIMHNDYISPDVNFADDDNTDGLVLYGSQWLAGDLKGILSTEHIQYYVDLLSIEIESGPDSRLIRHLISYMDAYDDGNFNTIMKVLENIRSVFQRELSLR